MRSSHADYFNHDEDAPGYDVDVLNESDPIRTGYDAVLDWVVASAKMEPTARVLELGSGTGNLTQRLPRCRELICVDVSEKMEEIAKGKLSSLENRTFLQDDILAVFDRDLGTFDTILSAYAIHHLTEDEKGILFQQIRSSLNEGGIAVFGDLMLENAAARRDKIGQYRKIGNDIVAEAFDEEFFWHLDEALAALRNLGFQVQWKRFSDLSYGIVGHKS